jgi:hypothetical protein
MGNSEVWQEGLHRSLSEPGEDPDRQRQGSQITIIPMSHLLAGITHFVRRSFSVGGTLNTQHSTLNTQNS